MLATTGAPENQDLERTRMERLMDQGAPGWDENGS